MENKQDSITIFDTLFTNNHIRMMKLLLPMLPPSHQKHIAIYIKYLELQYTLQYFSHHPYGFTLLPAQNNTNSFDFNNVYESLLPYCTPREKESFTQMRNMMNTFRNMQDMMEMMNTLKELFPEGFDVSGGGGIAPEILGNSGNPGGFGSMNSEMLANLFSMFGNAGMDMGQMADLFQTYS